MMDRAILLVHVVIVFLVTVLVRLEFGADGR